jgi:hypothetical protein
LSRWIEHSEEHTAEFRCWADKAGDVAPGVLAAALEKLGTSRIYWVRIHDIHIARKENAADNGH